jgi:general secretion pathway protein B
MSYILDALRRADSERERGAVPGIHAMPVPAAAAEEAPPPRRWTGFVAALAALLLVGVAAWWWGRSAVPAAVPAPLPVEAAPAPVADPAPPPSPPATPLPAAAPPVVALPAPIERRPTTREAAAAAERKVEGPAGAASTAGASARILARHELPEDLRRQLPPLTVSGSMFSPDPASRFVIINGQVLHEKAEIGPDHVLVQIKLRAAVLRYKGTLYEITF